MAAKQTWLPRQPVFEVNPTSLRSGKQLQAQLEEATQSHRVTRTGTSSTGMFGTPPSGTLPKPTKQPVEIPKQPIKPPACKAFSTFFKSSSIAPKPASKKVEGKKKQAEVVVEGVNFDGKKKRSTATERDKRKGIKKSNEGGNTLITDRSEASIGGAQASNNPLNISSASIILFDEADIVLEEDKGFLSTVQHFMATTKIPIVITATRPAIHAELSPRHEHIVLKRPPVKTVSSLLHTMCLSRGVRVDHASLTRVVRALKQDVRQCLLFLQFWCESGGGKTQFRSGSILNNSNHVSASLDTPSAVWSSSFIRRPTITSSDNSNDSDFLCLRQPMRKRRRQARLVDDDDDSVKPVDSNSGFTTGRGSSSSHYQEQVQVCVGMITQQRMDNNDGNAANSSLPLVHTGCDSSLVAGHSGFDIASSITDLIKDPLLDINGAVDKINHLESYLPFNVMYNSALHCCPLVKTDPLRVRLEIKLSQESRELLKKKRKRIIVGDWLDSDGSSDEGGCGAGGGGGDTGSSGGAGGGDTGGSGGAGGGDTGSSGGAGGGAIEDADADGVEVITAVTNVEVDDNPVVVNNIGGENPRAADIDKEDVTVCKEGECDTVVGLGEKCQSPAHKGDTKDEESKGVEKDAPTVILVNDKDMNLKDASVKKAEDSSPFMSKYLNVLSTFYENNSSVQSLYRVSGALDREDDKCCILPGFNDEELLKGDSEYDSHRVLSENICGCLELLSARTLVEGVGLCLKEEQEGEAEGKHSEEINCLPIGSVMPDVWTLERNTPDISNDAATKNIATCVGSGGHGSRSSLHLDYMPALREMCRFESQRQLTNAKRRFNHYFDYIGLNVRESTRVSLANTYSIARS